jgi:glycosyltransferase involved in cell wall biosynthesis
MRELTSKPTTSDAIDPQSVVDHRRLNDPVYNTQHHSRPARYQRPLVTVVAPAYNEALIIQDNLAILCDYMRSLEAEYEWELLVINDGSRDDSGALAEAFAADHAAISVIHHHHNQGLGQALRTGFSHAQGDYVVVVDLDLSYSPEHIGLLLAHIQDTQAGMVVASPYMPGGSIANVPWFRKAMSVWANRFLSLASGRGLATLTGMVRVYDAQLLRTLNLRSRGMDINPEIIHKALLLLAQIEEVPGHLHWRTPKAAPNPKAAPSRGPKKRKSSMKLVRHTLDILFSGFLFRPGMFFLIPSFGLFLLSLYSNTWVLIHCIHQFHLLSQGGALADPTEAVAHAFSAAPHTFFIGGMTLMLSIQMFSLGILSSQNRSYFEELFSLGSATYRNTEERRRGRR